MYLKEMKTLINNFIFFLFPFCVFAQSNTFRSNLNKQFSDVFTDTTSNSNTTQYLSIESRFFWVCSLSNKKEVYNTYLLGLSLEANIRNKLMLIAFYDYLSGNYNYEVQNYQDSLGIYYPGFGLDDNRFQFNAKYLANKFITVDVGYGKHFIGDGYQSLLLSDVASPFPYLKLTTEFGFVKYYNLYTTFLNPSMLDYGRKKHATIHYLDFSITPKIHFGVFESILWQSKSEGVNKGYELAYLNPVIFYRPVEFSKKTTIGNALMGAHFNATFKNTTFYGQFLLDDFNISRHQARDDQHE